MSATEVRRLQRTDDDVARAVVALLVEVFDEGAGGLTSQYVGRLLADPDVWLYAALRGGQAVGGLSAHVVPLTRSMTSELFVYDIAVRGDQQRRGIGRQLVEAARLDAARAGLESVWVLADVEDEHAVRFYREQDADATEVVMFTWSQPPKSRRAPGSR